MLPDPALPVRAALFALDLDPAALQSCHALLDADERVRSERFRHGIDRDRFVARRGQLRMHLAEEVGVAPARLRIGVDDHGKPFLPDHPRRRFNLSHSRGLALCVTAEDVAIGCDLECRDPALACPQVAARLFSAQERAALAALPADQWIDGFFRCWTRKEAYVKALGLGLSYPLDAFSVSVGAAAELTGAPPGWSLAALKPPPGYHAAVVVGAACALPRSTAITSASTARAKQYSQAA